MYCLPGRLYDPYHPLKEAESSTKGIFSKHHPLEYHGHGIFTNPWMVDPKHSMHVLFSYISHTNPRKNVGNSPAPSSVIGYGNMWFGVSFHETSTLFTAVWQILPHLEDHPSEQVISNHHLQAIKRPFGKGSHNPYWRDLLTMAIKHLLTEPWKKNMLLQKSLQ